MSIISLAIGKRGESIKDTTILSIEYYLIDYYFYEKNKYKELINFISRIAFFKIPNQMFYTIEHSGFKVYCLSKDKLNACVILNMETYPKRVLYNLLNQIIEEFQEKFKTEWEKSNKDFEFKLDSLKQHINNYQKPEQVDKISNIKYKLDDTKEIIIKSIDKILERGEKIEDLMQRSNDLSKSSIKFYKTTKKNE